ncbi:VOC family protein [Exiguobacterium acetylicum]|uniref:VOC family protein n=1 Tax=Exiguobacterium sp. BMC-KP TaxID=1684312 RepID=UPI0006AA4EB6|nr:VOC family protein [Exiguobacterium sp. BMC-KP]KOP29913.1 glyoxalase [Exiguobacterium sp. BMC-KP]
MIQYGYTILYSEDSSRTLTFYRDVLGLSVKAEHGSYIEFETGQTTLAFNTREDVQQLIPGYAIPSGNVQQTLEIGFVTDDVPALYINVAEAGYETVLAPVEKPWGQVVAYVLDPDGHLIELCSPM